MKLVLRERNYQGSLWHLTTDERAMRILEDDVLLGKYAHGEHIKPPAGAQYFLSFSRTPDNDFVRDRTRGGYPMVYLEFSSDIQKLRGVRSAPVDYYGREPGRDQEKEERLWLPQRELRGITQFIRSARVVVNESYGQDVEDEDWEEVPIIAVLEDAGIPYTTYPADVEGLRAFASAKAVRERLDLAKAVPRTVVSSVVPTEETFVVGCWEYAVSVGVWAPSSSFMADDGQELPRGFDLQMSRQDAPGDNRVLGGLTQQEVQQVFATVIDTGISFIRNSREWPSRKVMYMTVLAEAPGQPVHANRVRLYRRWAQDIANATGLSVSEHSGKLYVRNAVVFKIGAHD